MEGFVRAGVPRSEGVVVGRSSGRMPLAVKGCSPGGGGGSNGGGGELWAQAVRGSSGQLGRAHLVHVGAVRAIACEAGGAGSAASAARCHGTSHAGKAVARRTLRQGPHTQARGTRRLHPCREGARQSMPRPRAEPTGTTPLHCLRCPQGSLGSPALRAPAFLAFPSASLPLRTPPARPRPLFACPLPVVSVSPPCSSNLSASSLPPLFLLSSSRYSFTLGFCLFPHHFLLSRRPVSPPQLRSPHASHSITVFFRKVISLTCRAGGDGV